MKFGIFSGPGGLFAERLFAERLFRTFSIESIPFPEKSRSPV